MNNKKLICGGYIGGCFNPYVEEESWGSISLPLVRKTFGAIPAKEFLSVHPMTSATSESMGKIFYMDYTYGRETDLKLERIINEIKQHPNFERQRSSNSFKR